MANDPEAPTPRTIYRAALAGPIAAFLTSHGFRRKGVDYFLARDEANQNTKRIGFQLVWGNTLTAEVDVHAGVGWDKLREPTAWWFGAPVAEGAVQLGDNLGNIDSTGRFRHLAVRGACELSDVLLEGLTTSVLPFLHRYSDFHEALAYWEAEPGTPYQVPLARFLLGDRDGAIAIASQYIKHYETRADFRNLDRYERLLDFIRENS